MQDEEEENEGDPESGYANEERLIRVLALRASEETRWNSLYCFTIVQSDLMLRACSNLKNATIYCYLKC